MAGSFYHVSPLDFFHQASSFEMFVLLQARAAALDRTLAAQSADAERLRDALAVAVPSGSQQWSPGAQVRDAGCLEKEHQTWPPPGMAVAGRSEPA